MEEFDDMIHRTLANDDSGAGFPFKEAYWEQAKALIEADERRRRWRRLFFWWFGGSMLLLTIGAVAWQTMAVSSASSTSMPANAPEIQSPAPKSGHHNAGADAIGSTPAPTPSTTTAAPVNSATPAVSAAVVAGAHEKPSGHNNLSSNNPTQPRRQTMPSPAPKGANPVVEPDPVRPLTFSANNLAILPDQSTLNNIPSTPSATNDPAAVVTPMPITGQVPVPSSAEGQVWRRVLTPLPLRPERVHRQVEKPLVIPTEKPAMAETPTTQKVKTNPWSMGVTSGLGWSTAQLYDTKLNYHLGATVSRKLLPWLSVGLDAQARYVPGYLNLGDSTGSSFLPTSDFDNFRPGLVVDNVTENNYYSFGSSNVTEVTLTRGLLWLETPVFAEVHYGKVSLKGGVMPQYLLAVRKQRDAETSAQLLVDKRYASNKFWDKASNSAIDRFNIGYWGGLAWRPTRRLALEGRYHVVPMNPLNPELALVNPDNTKRINTGWAELRGIFYFR